MASAQVKELCWAEGRLAVVYPHSIVSLVQTEKDVNEPLILLTMILCVLYLLHVFKNVKWHKQINLTY